MANASGAVTDIPALYEQYHDRLRRFASLYLENRDDIDNSLMTVFTRLIEKRQKDSRFEPANWEAYLDQGVKNACLDMLKRAGPVFLDDVPEDQRPPQVSGPDPSGDEAARRLDDRRRLEIARAALMTLDERTRTIVIGVVCFDATKRDLGARLGLTGQRVGQLYNEGLRRLREEVTRVHA